ncbi:MAG: hypothetical protein HY326_10265 [Chloroflexi bacterium]|nr:hypothetical protein [Chloroflexota bacterium]
MNGMKKEYSGRVTIVILNIHNPDTFAMQKELGFTVTPDYFLVDENDKILGHWDESTDIPSLKKDIDTILASSPQ